MTGQWPISDFTWSIDTDSLGGFDVQRVLYPISYALGSWAQVCGVRFTGLGSAEPAGHGPQANLVIRFATDLQADPSVPPNEAQASAWLSGYELGLTDEPVSVGPDSTLVTRLNTTPIGGWDSKKLFQVVMHECGHFLGLDHAPEGVSSCMSAYLDEHVTVPGPWEITQVVAAYGPPRNQ